VKGENSLMEERSHKGDNERREQISLTKDEPISALARFAAEVKSENIPDPVIAKTADLFLDTIGCLYGGSGAESIKEIIDTIGLWGGEPQSTVFVHDIKTSAPQAAFANAVMIHARDYDDTHDTAVNHGCVCVVPAMIAVTQLLAMEWPGRDDALQHTDLSRQEQTRSENMCKDDHTGGLPIRRSTPQENGRDFSQKHSGNHNRTRNEPISGRQFFAAMAVALDVANRISLSLIPFLSVGWLPTTITGPFGAACGVGKLLGLSAEEMQHAFGFAYAQVHGNRQALVEGTLAKRMQPAFSAAAGINAAFFAAQGLTAASRIFTGEYGLPALYTGGNYDTAPLTKDLGTRWETENISIKPYPSCRCTHPVIDDAHELKEKTGVSADDIAEGTVYLPPTGMGQIGFPFEIRGNPTVDAQFSAQYTAALTFVSGRPTVKDFEAERIRERTDVAELAKKFGVIEFERDSTGLTPVEVHLRLKNNSTMQVRVEAASGSPEKPLSRSDLIGKARDNFSYAACPPSAEKQEKMIEVLTSVTSADDINTIFNQL
jgi:2-methylcitrate dehydratase PrpD